MCENLGGFSFRMLIFGRLIAGVGVGITSAAGPAFISDTGRLVEGMEMEMGWVDVLLRYWVIEG